MIIGWKGLLFSECWTWTQQMILIILIAESQTYLIVYHCTKRPTHVRCKKNDMQDEWCDDGMLQMETHPLYICNDDLKIHWFYIKIRIRTSKEILNMGNFVPLWPTTGSWSILGYEILLMLIHTSHICSFSFRRVIAPYRNSKSHYQSTCDIPLGIAQHVL